MRAASSAICTPLRDPAPSFITAHNRSASHTWLADSLAFPKATRALRAVTGMAPYCTMVTFMPFFNVKVSRGGITNGLGALPGGGACLAGAIVPCAPGSAPSHRRRRW